MLSERLMLAGKFCEPLSPGIKSSLLGWARWIETDPARRAILRDEPPPVRLVPTLTPGYRLAARRATHPEVEDQLRVLASGALNRLNLCLAMVGALAMMTLTSLVLGGREPSPARSPVSFSLAAVVGLFWGWELLDLAVARLGQSYLPHNLSGIPRGLALAGASYMVTAALAILAAKKWGWKPLHGHSLGWVGPGFFLCLSCVTLTDYLVEWSFGARLPLPPLMVYLLLRGSPTDLVQVALLACILAPLFEELVFRGWLLGGLLPHLGPRNAVVLSSLFFALSHGDAAHVPELFVLGVALGWVYLRSGSLWVAVTVHAMWNFWAMCEVIANGT